MIDSLDGGRTACVSALAVIVGIVCSFFFTRCCSIWFLSFRFSLIFYHLLVLELLQLLLWPNDDSIFAREAGLNDRLRRVAGPDLDRRRYGLAIFVNVHY